MMICANTNVFQRGDCDRGPDSGLLGSPALLTFTRSAGSNLCALHDWNGSNLFNERQDQSCPTILLGIVAVALATTVCLIASCIATRSAAAARAIAPDTDAVDNMNGTHKGGQYVRRQHHGKLVILADERACNRTSTITVACAAVFCVLSCAVMTTMRKTHANDQAPANDILSSLGCQSVGAPSTALHRVIQDGAPLRDCLCLVIDLDSNDAYNAHDGVPMGQMAPTANITSPSPSLLVRPSVSKSRSCELHASCCSLGLQQLARWPSLPPSLAATAGHCTTHLLHVNDANNTKEWLILCTPRVPYSTLLRPSAASRMGVAAGGSDDLFVIFENFVYCSPITDAIVGASPSPTIIDVTLALLLRPVLNPHLAIVPSLC